MPIGGENIGTAYVRIIADGDGLDESIRRQFDESEDSVRDGGRAHGRTYADAFDEEYKKKFKGNFAKSRADLFKDTNDALTSSLARMKLSDEFFGGREWKQFRRRMVDEFGDAGALAGQRLEKRFRDSTNLEGLASEMKRVGPQVRRAQNDILEQFFADARAMNKKITDDRLKQEKDGLARALKLDRDSLAEAYQDNRAFNNRKRALLEEAYRDNKAFDRRRLKAERDMLTEAYQMNKGFNRQKLADQHGMLAEAHKMNKLFDETEFKRRLDLDREFDLRHEQGQRKSFTRDHDRINLLIRDIDRLADIGGGASGRGSRNNFLNFVGSTVRNLIRTLRIVPQVLTGVSDVVAFVTKGFKEGAAAGEGFFGTLVKGAAGGGGALLTVLSESIPGLIALAAAAAIAVAALGPLVSIASGLVAGLTALAGAITFGLIGALAPLVGLLPVVGFGVAALATAFIGLKKEGLKDLKETIKPITSGLRDLGTEVRKGLFSRITEDSKALGATFKGLEPLFRGIGRAVADTLHMMLAEFNGPGGKAFLRDMTTFIPAAIRDLGEVFVHTLGGFGGVFRALIPVTQTFLEWLEKITFQFANWSNSTRGQNTLKKFFDDAWKSAKDLGGLLRETFGLIGDLFDAGRGQGNSMLTDMTEQVHDLRNFLAAHPTALKDWFNNGLDTMRSVAGIIKGIGLAVAELDTPNNRFIAQVLFNMMANGIRAVAFAFKLLLIPMQVAMAAFHGFRLAGAQILRAVAAMEDGFGNMMDALSHVPGFDWAKHAAGNLHDAADQARGLARGLENVSPPKIDTTGAKRSIGSLRQQVDGFPKSFVVAAVADVADAHKDFGALRNQIDQFPHKPLIFSVIAEIRSVKVAQDNTRKLMNQLVGVDEFRARARADVDTKRAHNNVRQLIDDLHDVKPKTVDANVRTAQGHKNMRELMNDIDHFHGKTVDANVRTQQAHSNMRQLIDDIGQFHDKTVTITTRNVKVGSTSGKSANPTNNAAGAIYAPNPGLGHLIRVAEVPGQSEAVVPLNRPLSQVDPSVRLLSAIAQGLATPNMAAGGVTPSSGKTLTIGELHLHSPTEDPRAAANEFLNTLVATGY